MTGDKPISEADPAEGEREVALFASEEDAVHVVALHNARLFDPSMLEDCQSDNGPAR